MVSERKNTGRTKIKLWQRRRSMYWNYKVYNSDMTYCYAIGFGYLTQESARRAAEGAADRVITGDAEVLYDYPS